MNAINFKDVSLYKDNYSLMTKENDVEIKGYLSYTISKQIECQVDLLLDEMIRIIVKNIYGGNNKDE